MTMHQRDCASRQMQRVSRIKTMFVSSSRVWRVLEVLSNRQMEELGFDGGNRRWGLNLARREMLVRYVAGIDSRKIHGDIAHCSVYNDGGFGRRHFDLGTGT